jgi:hypothetical protein
VALRATNHFPLLLSPPQGGDPRLLSRVTVHAPISGMRFSALPCPRKWDNPPLCGILASV